MPQSRKHAVRLIVWGALDSQPGSGVNNEVNA